MGITPYVTTAFILLLLYVSWNLLRIDKRNGPDKT
jgi:preprotein translocase subunit SecY